MPSESCIVLGHSDFLTVICPLNKGKVDAKYGALQYVGRYHISDTIPQIKQWSGRNSQYTYLHNIQKRCVICALRSMKYVYKQLDVPSMNKKQFNSKYPTKDVQYRICSKVAGITSASPCPIHILSAFLWRGKSVRKSLSRMLQEIFDNIKLN